MYVNVAAKWSPAEGGYVRVGVVRSDLWSAGTDSEPVSRDEWIALLITLSMLLQSEGNSLAHRLRGGFGLVAV